MHEPGLCEIGPDGKKVNFCKQALALVGQKGCETDDLDEYGYCHHLVGWSNDGKIVEPWQPMKRKDKEGRAFLTHHRTVLHSERQAVKDTDLIFNPTHKVVVDNVEKIVDKWVSSRVYRPDAKPLNKPLDVPSPTPKAEENEVVKLLKSMNARLEKLEKPKKSKPKKKVAKVQEPEPALA